MSDSFKMCLIRLQEWKVILKTHKAWNVRNLVSRYFEQYRFAQSFIFFAQKYN